MLMTVIKSTSVRFESGMLLSREMLEQMEMNDHLFKLQYDSYPDGIIYGFEYIEEADKSYLTSGLLKYNGKYFFSEGRIDIFALLDEFDNENLIGKTVHSAIAFVPCMVERTNEGIVSDCLQIKLCDKEEIDVSAVILGEFQYFSQKRVLLPKRSPKEELQAQLYANENYYSFINVEYSLPDCITFSPYIFTLFRKCLSSKANKSYADIALLFMLCQNKVVSLKVLNEWFAYYKTNVDIYDRRKIIETFLDIISKDSIVQEEKETIILQSENKEKVLCDTAI